MVGGNSRHFSFTLLPAQQNYREDFRIYFERCVPRPRNFAETQKKA